MTGATLRLDPGEARGAVAAVLAAAIAGLLLGATLYLMLGGFASSFYTSSIALDGEELRRLIDSGEFFAVMFSSDSCPTCKRMEPYWVSLAEEGFPVYIVKLEPDTVWAFKENRVEATPTFIAFRGGVQVSRWEGTFPGPDVSTAMRAWLIDAERGVGGLEGRGESLSRIQGLTVEPEVSAAALLFYLVAGLSAGLAVAASPCTLPALAVYASASAKLGLRWIDALIVAGGAAISVAAVGGVALVFGAALQGVQGLLIYAASLTMVALGVAWGIGLEVFIPLSAGLPLTRPLAGLAYGLIASQCSLPVIVAIAAILFASPTVAGVAMLGGLTLGAAAPVAVVTLAAGRSQQVVKRLTSGRARTAFGAAMALSGLAILVYEASGGIPLP